MLVQVSSKKMHPMFETVIIHTSMDNTTPNMVCEIPKNIAVIPIDSIHVV